MQLVFFVLLLAHQPLLFVPFYELFCFACVCDDRNENFSLQFV